jgi:membrane-associated protease RseP (regulator of RpoE activity)
MDYLIALALVVVLVAGFELLWRRVAHKWLATALGAGAGYLYISSLAFVLFTCRGVQMERAWYTVDSVVPGFDAAGKLLPGDRIVAVDGAPIRYPSTQSLVEAINSHDGAAVTFAVERGDQKLDVTVQPKLDPRDDGKRVWVVGIKPRLDHDFDRDTGHAIGHALRAPLWEARELAGELAPKERADPGGPKRIVDEFPRPPDGWLWLKLALRDCTFVLALLVVVGGVRAFRYRAR